MGTKGWNNTVTKSAGILKTALVGILLIYTITDPFNYSSGSLENKEATFTVDFATESDKIFRNSVFSSPTLGAYTLSLAGNEYGSFQLVISTSKSIQQQVEIAFSDMVALDGSIIPVENFQWFRVAYVNASPSSGSFVAPDPLLSAKPFDIAQGTQAAIWVDILMPEGMPKLTFSGTVTVKAGEESISRDLVIRSYGFDIPKKSSLETDYWFNPGSWNWWDYTPKMYEEHAKILGKYRISSFPGDWTVICKQVKIYREADGKFTFDWSVFDKFVSIALDNGTTAFWSSLAPNGGWLLYLNLPTTEVTDRSTGQIITMDEILTKRRLKNPWKFYEDDPEVAQDNPVLMEFLKRYPEHLKNLGIDKISYFENFDEAQMDDRWDAMIKWHTFLKQEAPNLQIMNLGVDPTRKDNGKSPLGLADGWAPMLIFLDQTGIKDLHPQFHQWFRFMDFQNPPSIHETMLQRREVHGEKMWAYTCCGLTDAEGQYEPYPTFIRPYISGRMQYWFAWQYQLDGYFNFAMNLLNPDVVLQENAEFVWHDNSSADNGLGYLVYPTETFGIVPSMRLANIREGLEDYEYFALLKRQAQLLDPETDTELLQQINQELVIDSDIITSIYKWTKDPAMLNKKRDKLAELIILTKPASDKILDSYVETGLLGGGCMLSDRDRSFDLTLPLLLLLSLWRGMRNKSPKIEHCLTDREVS